MKLQLNFNKPDNYAFFCPVSKVHLTRSNPVAFVDGTTPYIERGLKSKAIIEIAEDITGQKANTKEKAESVKNEPIQEVKESIPSVEEKVVDTVEETKKETVATEPVESKPIQQEAPAPSEKPRKGRQKKA